MSGFVGKVETVHIHLFRNCKWLFSDGPATQPGPGQMTWAAFPWLPRQKPFPSKRLSATGSLGHRLVPKESLTFLWWKRLGTS